MIRRLLIGDCRDTLATLSDQSVHCCVTSPPYFGLRDYGHDGQMGQESTPDEFVAGMVAVFREVRRVLRDDGTLWLNIGDSYAGGGNGGGGSFAKDGIRTALPGTDKNKATRHGRRGAVGGIKSKDLIGIPWMLAFALRADGWYLRQEIIWHKPNPMPESVTDRCTKAHESVFLLSKSPRYYFDAAAIAEAQASDHTAGNHSHKGATAYEGGAGEHRTKAGLVAFAQRSRVQAKRAAEIAEQVGLTDAHIAAIRAVGITDTGKARVTQNGCGKNGPAVQALADEAKAALGGYYREFLIVGRRNKRSVWTVPTRPFKEAHFATFPPALVEPCILAGSPIDGTVLDPFFGAGTTGLVAQQHGRQWIGCELNSEYGDIARRRLNPPLAFHPILHWAIAV